MADCLEYVAVLGPVARQFYAWDGGARSAIAFDGDCYFGWQVAGSVAGAVVGLNSTDGNQHFSEIDHGFYFERGEFQIMEAGVAKTQKQPFATADRFYIFRVGDDVLYVHKTNTDYSAIIIDPRYPSTLLPAPVLHVSDVPSTTVAFLDASLYGFGDYVFNEEAGGSLFVDGELVEAGRWLPSGTEATGSLAGQEAVGVGQLGFTAFGIGTGAPGATDVTGFALGGLPFVIGDTNGDGFTGTQGANGPAQLPFLGYAFENDVWAIGFGQLGFAGGLGNGSAGSDGLDAFAGGLAPNGLLSFEGRATGRRLPTSTGNGFVGFKGFALGRLSTDSALEAVALGDLTYELVGYSLSFTGAYFDARIPPLVFENLALFTEELLSGLNAGDLAEEQYTRVALIAETFVASLATSSNYAFALREGIVTISELRQFTQQAVELLDAANIVDAQGVALAVRLFSAILTTDYFDIQQAVNLADELVATGAVETFYQATELIRAAIGVADAAIHAGATSVAESVVATEELRFALVAHALISESFVASDDARLTLTVMALLSDSLATVDSTQTDAQFFAALTDAAQVISLLKTPAELSQGWVMNTEGAQPISEYSNYTFNSLAYGTEQMLGAADDGIYELDGDTDEGESITAELTTMMLDFATSRLKRIRSAYIGYTAAGQLVLKVRSVRNGELVEHWYTCEKTTDQPAPGENRVLIGQGLRSRYWQFELTNVDGADFEVDQLELYPLILSRRV